MNILSYFENIFYFYGYFILFCNIYIIENNIQKIGVCYNKIKYKYIEYYETGYLFIYTIYIELNLNFSINFQNFY